MRQNSKSKKTIIGLQVVLAVFLSWSGFAFGVKPAQAATMSISPGNVNVRPGQNFVLNVSVSSTDQAANAVSGTVSFPANLLEVASISKSGSVVTMWAEEPSFSNSAGVVSFEGIILNPGYTGSGGRIISITMRPKASGTGTVRFSSSAVLANDGRGTNILTGAGNSQVSISDVSSEEETVQQPTAEPTSVPGAVAISSSTHPDSTKWYQSKNISFGWTNPSGVTGVNILGDRVPDTDPGTVSDGNFSTYSYQDVEDGVWYFHLKLRNNRGWGPTSHFKFNVDSQPPTELTIKQGLDKNHGILSFNIRSADSGSGISRFETIVDGGESVFHDYTQDFVFTTEKLSVGEHSLVVKAFDQAGNEITREISFTVAPYQDNVRPEISARSFQEFWVSQWDKINQPWVWILILLVGLLLILKFMPVEWFAWIGNFAGHGRINHQVYREMTSLQMNLVNQIAMLEGAKLKRKLTKEETRVLSAIKDMLLEVDEMLINYVKQSKSGRK